jgi:hypothetical protein
VPQDLPEWFIKKAKGVTAKRAKTVIDHILQHGQITTEDLKNFTAMTTRRGPRVTCESKEYPLRPFASRAPKAGALRHIALPIHPRFARTHFPAARSSPRNSRNRSSHGRAAGAVYA